MKTHTLFGTILFCISCLFYGLFRDLKFSGVEKEKKRIQQEEHLKIEKATSSSIKINSISSQRSKLKKKEEERTQDIDADLLRNLMEAWEYERNNLK